MVLILNTFIYPPHKNINNRNKMNKLILLIATSFLLFSCEGDKGNNTEGLHSSDQIKDVKKTDPVKEKADFEALQDLEDHLMNNDLTIDIKVAKDLYGKALSFTKEFPNSENLELALDYAAKGAENGGLYKEAVEMYHQLGIVLPESNKTPIYMYEKGKVLEDKMQNKEAAKAAYKELIKRYPRNPLSKDMKSYLKNGVIDMTKEEKIK